MRVCRIYSFLPTKSNTRQNLKLAPKKYFDIKIEQNVNTKLIFNRKTGDMGLMGGKFRICDSNLVPFCWSGNRVYNLFLAVSKRRPE